MRALTPAPGATDALVRAAVADALGTATRVVTATPLQAGREHAVLDVALDRAPHRVVLKVAPASAAPAIDLRRTAAVMALARAAGAPVAAVLGAGAWGGTLGSTEGGTFLITEHVEGVPWRRVRPLLDDGAVAGVHRALARALLAVQSVVLPGFGELDAAAVPAGVDVLTALRRRAALRVTDAGRRALFLDVLEREAALFAEQRSAVLTHDDLHHDNVLLRPGDGGWRLAGLLDWDKAWAGPAESDVARTAFWDDMTGPGLWEVYRAAVPAAPGADRRALVHQLLWCLEHPVDTPRHRADTAAVLERLGAR